MFDEMCAQAKVSKSGLVELPLETAVGMFKKISGRDDVDPIKLQQRIFEYAAVK